MRRRRGLAVGLLAGLIVVQFLVGLGSYGLMDPDEPRYAEGARSLRDPGADPFVPHFNGAPRLVKPILSYWLICGAYSVVGVNEWGARLPSALAGIGIVLLIFALGRRLVDETTGWLAAVVACTSLLLVAMARIATTDALLAFFITLAIYAHVLARQGERGRAWPVLLLWVALSLAMATKGPVGLFVPAVVILAEAGVRHGYGRIMLASLAPIVVFLLLAEFIGPFIYEARGEEGRAWVPLVYAAQGVAVLVVIGLGARLLRREPGTLVVPIAVALMLSLVGFALPLTAGESVVTLWGAFLILAGAGFGALLVLAYRRDPAATRRRYVVIGLAIFMAVGLSWYALVLLRDRSIANLFVEETGQRFTGNMEAHLEPPWFFLPMILGGFIPWSIGLIPAARRVHDHEEGLARSLPLVWMLAVLGFFSLSPNKIYSYMLPAAPGVALLVGIWLRRGLSGEAPTVGRWLLGLAAGLQAVALIAGFALPEESVPGGRPVALVSAALLSVATMAAVIGRRRPVVGVVGLALGLVLAFGYAAWQGLPKVAELRSEKAIESILTAYPDAELISHHSLSTGLVFYGRREVRMERHIRGVAARLDSPRHVLAWVETENLGQLKKRFRALTGESEGPWPLHATPERTLVTNKKDGAGRN